MPRGRRGTLRAKALAGKPEEGSFLEEEAQAEGQPLEERANSSDALLLWDGARGRPAEASRRLSCFTSSHTFVHRAGVPGGWVDDRRARPPNPGLGVGMSLPGALPPGGPLGALRPASREHTEGSGEAGPGAQSGRGFGSFGPAGLGPRKRWLAGGPGHITCPSTSVSRHGCQSLPPCH